MPIVRSAEDIHAKTDELIHLLERHRVLTTLVGMQQTARRDLLEHMQRRENLTELQRHVKGLHPADMATILASLPPDDRAIVWQQLPRREAGLVLVEATPDVRDAIVEHVTIDELGAAVAELDADDLAYVSDSLPPDVLAAATAALAARDRSWLVDTQAYPADSVGRLMTQDVLLVRDDQTIGDAIAALRAREALPDQTDRLFVVDARHLLRGTLPFQTLLRRIRRRRWRRRCSSTSPHSRRPSRPPSRQKPSSGTTSCRRRSSTNWARWSDA